MIQTQFSKELKLTHLKTSKFEWTLDIRNKTIHFGPNLATKFYLSFRLY